MVEGKLTDGTTPRNWKWEIVRTPEEWWTDYSEDHPEFDPYSLDSETFRRIYGEKTKLPEAARLNDPHGAFRFMDNFFGDAFKYQFLMTGYKYLDDETYRKRDGPKLRIVDGKLLVEATIEDIKKRSMTENIFNELFQETNYSPMTDAPNAYLKFCRLSRLIELGWPSEKIKKEIFKFVDKYGPPWWVEPPKWQSPPFENATDEGPLTMEHILWESQEMRWVVDTYRLLIESEIDRDSIGSLRRHIKKLYEQDPGIEREVDPTSDKENPTSRYPPLDTDGQVAAFAVDYIIGKVNVYLTQNSCGLSNRPLRNSLIGAWIQTYKFTNLLSAMWLQFYLEILNNGKFRECANENCRVLFPVSHSNKEYCSKECGIKQYMRTHRKTKEANHERPHRKEE